ncbi:MAG: NIPSNAP family protein [Pseudomonadota bacterium]
MITCTVHYELDPDKLDAFETYAKVWIHLVTKLGGTHHGYFLPHEGRAPSRNRSSGSIQARAGGAPDKDDRASCHFSFPSLAAYEAYREKMHDDPECQRAYAFARQTGCIRRYDRTFERPVLTGAPPQELGL